MGRADKRPLLWHGVEDPSQKLPEASGLFDQSEHGFVDFLLPGILASSLPGPEHPFIRK